MLVLQVFTLQEKYKEAIQVYLEALEFSPENPDLLTTVGLLYLRLGENYRAFDYLGNSLTHDPKNAKVGQVLGSGVRLGQALDWVRR
jgi:Bardet-Biedl syndrome 4 protein